MTALAADRMISRERWTRRRFTLASGNIAYKGAMACLDLSTGKVEPGHAETDLLVIGTFAEQVDATAADKTVDIDLGREIEVVWYVNDGTSIASTDVGSVCYVKDDQSVTITPTGASIAGRIWAVETTRGVAVEKLQAIPAAVSTLDSLTLVETSPGAFAANDLIIGSSPNSGAVYDIPATGAASTVTLPATATEGTLLTFVADGTKNGHTVQYRDATGPANLTAALTASKRHQVHAVYLNGLWTANAYISP
jgi:fibronectin type 3 domain-containing protein